MKSQKTYYLDIAPLTNIPISRDPWFTYQSAREVPVGSLVTITLFRRLVRGVVLTTHTTRRPALAGIPLKPLSSVVEESFLTPDQLALARTLSETTFTSLGQCLKHFIPKRVHARKTAPEVSESIPQPPKSLTPEQISILEQLTQSQATHPQVTLLTGPPASGKTELALQALTERLRTSTQAQALILVPEITLVETARLRARAYWSEQDIVALHSRLSDGAFFENWERIHQGEARVIIGTRQALFAPFTQLDMIVIDDEHDDSYKQWDMAPRYDARILARTLAQLHQAQLLLISSTPSLTQWQAAQTGQVLHHALSPLPGHLRPEILLVDLKLERWKKNFSSLSVPLTDAISAALVRHEQTLLFVNHRGMSHFSICVHCKEVLRCPTCETALVLQKGGTYRCFHCRYRTDEFPACAHCRRTEFRNLGLGTERVEREIEKRFPHARIGRLDHETLTRKHEAQTLARRFREGTLDILIGTQAAILGWNLPDLSLIGIIDADSLFALPDFHTEEKALQILVQAIGRTARQSHRSTYHDRVLIQTFHPENPVFRTLQQGDLKPWYEATLDERSVLKYPPFRRFVLLQYRGRSSEDVDSSTQMVYDTLSRLDLGPSVRIDSPATPFIAKKRGFLSKNILIRLLPDTPIPTSLSDQLKRLSSGWSIDVDPVNIL